MRIARAASRWLLAAGVLLFGAASARAEGPGVKLGDRLLLHVGSGVEFRYQDNLFYADTNKVGAFSLHLTPYVALATRTSRDQSHLVDFRLSAGLDYREYLTSDPNISRYRGYAVLANGLLTIAPGRVFTMDLFDNFNRSTQLPYQPAGGATGLPQMDRDTNQLGARFRIRPGGGRLELNLLYSFGLDFFEADLYRGYNLFVHTAAARVQWRFFPKTALYVDFNYRAYRYANPAAAIEFRPDSNPIRVIAGLNGLLLTKLSFNAYIGYGNGLYNTTVDPTTGMQINVNPNTPIGGVELRWRPSVLSDGAIGYRHDFNNSFIGFYYDLDAVYLSWLQRIWRFSAFARLEYSNNRYQGVTAATAISAPGGRVDNYLTFSFRVEYPFKDWLSLALGYDLAYNNTNAQFMTGSPVSPLVPLNYLTNTVWLRLQLAY